MKSSNMKLVYASLDDLRRDKRKLGRSLRKKAEVTKTDAVDYVVSSNGLFFSSDFSYLHYIDYAIKAYKAYHVLKKVSGLISKFRNKK